MLQKLQQAWYSKTVWVWCLAPLSLLFWALTSLRRKLYALGVFSSKSANIPVIVVGNIGIGGNGKTPLVLALIRDLRERGFYPAVLSRGYGGNQTHFPYLVNKVDSPQLVGDEPALLMQRESPVMVIDPVRARGVDYIESNTTANIVICDDGLQHYAMKRDVELCVLDKRGVGNGYLLPMGPLREGTWRLNEVNAVVRNIGFANYNECSARTKNLAAPEFTMCLKPMRWVNIRSNEYKSLSDFTTILEQTKIDGLSIEALAGIGDPKRFFDTLLEMNVHTQKQRSFADHYQFKASDIPRKSIVLMTEKDAVKCTQIAHDNCWYLEINAVLPDDFYQFIEHEISAKAKQLTQSRA